MLFVFETSVPSTAPGTLPDLLPVLNKHVTEWASGNANTHLFKLTCVIGVIIKEGLVVVKWKRCRHINLKPGKNNNYYTKKEMSKWVFSDFKCTQPVLVLGDFAAVLIKMHMSNKECTGLLSVTLCWRSRKQYVSVEKHTNDSKARVIIIHSFNKYFFENLTYTMHWFSIKNIVFNDSWYTSTAKKTPKVMYLESTEVLFTSCIIFPLPWA